MAIQNINIQVQPHQPARASDFNTVSGKVHELVDAYNALGATIHAVTDADALHDKSQIGTYVLLPVLSSRYFSGLLSVSYVPFGSTTRITQTLLSSTTPQYDEAGQLKSWLNEPCTMARYYDGGAWSPWQVSGANAEPDLTGYYKCVAMEQADLEGLTCADTEEGILYLGLGEVIDRPDSFRFGGTFPIKFS